MKRLYAVFILISLFLKGFAQDIPVKQDSLKTDITTAPSPEQNDSIKSGNVMLKLPRINPTEKLQPQFTPYDRFTISTQRSISDSGLPAIQWNGIASDFINSKSRTAIATTMPTPNLLLHASATLGLVETPWFGKGTYYILDAGAKYAISPALNVGLRGGYNSDFGTLPYWNAGIDVSYLLTPNLMIDGSLTYLQTAANNFNINQSAVLIDLHGRYRLNDDWYLNAYGGMPVRQENNQQRQPMMPMMNTPYYGGSVEHWFNPTTGVEGGMIWMRDMFTGKMRPQPKFEILFRPGR